MSFTSYEACVLADGDEVEPLQAPEEIATLAVARLFGTRARAAHAVGSSVVGALRLGCFGRPNLGRLRPQFGSGAQGVSLAVSSIEQDEVVAPAS